MAKPTLTVTKDFTKKFNDIVSQFKHDAVLVGIPDDSKERKEGQEITNAALLAINNFGSPINNIPPRPVMSIGIKLAQEPIAEEFKKAAVGALTQGLAALDIYYNRAGSIAANSIKKVINDQTDIEGPSEATLATREANGFKGTKSLVVTGQMRNAITWVVK